MDAAAAPSYAAWSSAAASTEVATLVGAASYAGWGLAAFDVAPTGGVAALGTWLTAHRSPMSWVSHRMR